MYIKIKWNLRPILKDRSFKILFKSIICPNLEGHGIHVSVCMCVSMHVYFCISVCNTY